MVGAEEQHLFRILDDNIKRSNKLGDWTAPEIIDFEYWEVRYILPEKVMEGVDELFNYFDAKYKIKNCNLADKVSFYFWIKDELMEVAKMEQQVLTPLNIQKSSYKQSPRAKEYYYLIELDNLADGCPIKKEKIKKMKYSVIFETLLANVINSEGEWKVK